MGGWRIAIVLGRLLVGFGVLVLLFVAYLLWGTGIGEARHQDALRTEFDHALAARHPAGTAGSTAPADGATGGSSPLVRQLAAGDAPGEGQPVAVIDIPKIGVDDVVVQGTAHQDLALGPGHYDGTPLPGQMGNVAIAGHRTTYGAPFYNLDELRPGDRIAITTLQGRFSYTVVRSFVVAPDETSVLDASSAPTLTLTTCNPRFSAAQRLVVRATLDGPAAPAPGGPASASAVSAGRARHASSGLAGGQGSWGGAVPWALGALALGVAVGLVARGRGRGRRWAAYGAGVLPMLVVLYFFFENVSPLLPASF